jgi:hypothetical protein
VSSSISQDAIEIINAAPEEGPLDMVSFAEELPAEAAGLAHTLHSADLARIVETYQKSDHYAIWAQKWFNRVALSAAYSGFLAAAIGGLLLYKGALGFAFALGVLQFIFLAISLLGSVVLYLWKPFRTWRLQRGQAEDARVKYFSTLVALPGDSQDALLLPLKLECFRRHLLESQIAYFGRRGHEHRATVRLWTAVRIVSLVLIVIAATVPVLPGLTGPSWLSAWVPEWLRMLLSLVPLTGFGVQETYALAGLLGASLQGLLASLSSISLAERNAERYEAMKTHLEETYLGRHLADARAAAAGSRQEAVEAYVSRVADDLLLETSDWGAWHQARAEMTARLLGQHRVPSVTA